MFILDMFALCIDYGSTQYARHSVAYIGYHCLIARLLSAVRARILCLASYLIVMIYFDIWNLDYSHFYINLGF